MMSTLLAAENMRDFTNPKTGQVSVYWWLRPAGIAAGLLLVWWRQKRKR
jgi:hypothetical protein